MVSVLGERCSALAFSSDFSVFLFGGRFVGHALWILFCTAFYSGLVFCSGMMFCSAFSSLKRCFVHLAKFGANSVDVR